MMWHPFKDMKNIFETKQIQKHFSIIDMETPK